MLPVAPGIIPAIKSVRGEPGSFVATPSIPSDVSEELVFPGAHTSYVVTDWIEAHKESEDCKRTLEKIIEAIQYIRWSQFLGALRDSVESIKGRLDEIYADQDGFKSHTDAVVLVEKEKSNQWVAEVALEHLDFLAHEYVALGSKGAQKFSAYLSHENPDFKKNLVGKIIVLFDDASFSGTQLHEHVTSVMRAVERARPRGIVVIAPFMTGHAAAKIVSLSTRVLPVFLSDHKRIPTLAEIDLPESGRGLVSRLWGYSDSDLTKLGLTWFSHKVPNYMSFPQPIAHGSIYKTDGTCVARKIGFIPEVLPVYKRGVNLIWPDVLQVKRPRFVRAEEPAVFGGPPIVDVASIVEMKRWMDVNKLEPETSLVFSDIDDTLVCKGLRVPLEPITAATISSIQAKGFKVVGCTARPVEHAQLTLLELSEMGISLGTEAMRKKIEVIAFGKTNSYLYKGIIYADGSSRGKGEGVHFFCSELSRKIDLKYVLMIDDKMEELEKVFHACLAMRVGFKGFCLAHRRK